MTILNNSWERLAEVETYVAAQHRYAERRSRRPIDLSKSLIEWLGVPSLYNSTTAALKPTPQQRAEVVESLRRLLQSMAPSPFFFSGRRGVGSGRALSPGLERMPRHNCQRPHFGVGYAALHYLPQT